MIPNPTIISPGVGWMLLRGSIWGLLSWKMRARSTSTEGGAKGCPVESITTGSASGVGNGYLTSIVMSGKLVSLFWISEVVFGLVIAIFDRVFKIDLLERISEAQPIKNKKNCMILEYFFIKQKIHRAFYLFKKTYHGQKMNVSGIDGTRTRNFRRDRAVL